MRQLHIRCILILSVLLITISRISAQTGGVPDVFLKNTIKEQLNFLDEHTRIYDNYRAVREDMFQKLKNNVSDTLNSSGKKIAGLNRTKSKLNTRIDSLKTSLETVKTNLDEMTRTKNSIKVIGLDINKLTYNKVMWTILGGLVAALLVGFLIFKRNLTLISNTKKEYLDLKNEFEAYRKASREAREKMTMAHFLEIKKLKGE